jgi:hypothetical protein
MLKPLPIGIQNFRKLIEDGYLFDLMSRFVAGREAPRA